MRVIAGSLGGRQFVSPTGHRTHPMSEKMRGAMFGVLGDIKGLTVLDPFAGSGALSFEAISRGAHSAVLIDIDKQAQEAIEANIETLQLQERTRYVRANAISWSNKNRKQVFNLLLVDPPYDKLPFAVIEKLARNLKPRGIYVLSWPGQFPAPNLPGLEVVSNKHYGDAQLFFYKHIPLAK